MAAVTKVVPYELGAEESPENRSLIGLTKLIGTYDESVKLGAVNILTGYLAGNNDAPLKRAVLDSGLAQDFTLSLETGSQQAIFSWLATNTEQANLEGLRKVIRDTVSGLLERGLDRSLLRACYHRYAFRQLDREGGWANRSLLEALGMLDTWLYGGDPAKALLVESDLKALEEKLDTDWFESLLRELFLEEDHDVTLVLVPSKDIAAEKREKEAARLRAEAARWTEADRASLREQAEALRLWQQTPDSPENLASIPMLKLSDLAEKPEPIRMTETRFRGVTLLRHEVTTPIANLTAYFRAGDLKQEELPVLACLGDLLSSMATKKHSRSELMREIWDTLGDLRISAVVEKGSTPEKCRPLFSVSVSCLPEMAEKAAALLGEFFTETVWEDRDLLQEVLRQNLADFKMSLAGAGLNLANLRAGSAMTAAAAAEECIKGVTMLKWLEQITQAGEEAQRKLLAEIAGLAKRLLTRDRLVLSVSPAFPDSALGKLTDLLPTDGVYPPEEAEYPLSGSRGDGLLIPGQVGYAVMLGNFLRHGDRYTGVGHVLKNVLNYMYLWNEIRVQGGAYGCGFIYQDHGAFGFYSYRDPQPARSLEVYTRAADFLRQFCASSPDLTGPILSSVSSLDPMRNSAAKMGEGEIRWFRGQSQEEIDRQYAALLRTTPADLLALAGMLEDMRADNAVCVSAGQAQLEACGEQIKEIISL